MNQLLTDFRWGRMDHIFLDQPVKHAHAA
jgi:hypothetical protein